MMHPFRVLLAIALAAMTVPDVLAERLSPERLWDFGRIGDAAVSPDGSQLAYLVTRYDLEANEGTTSLVLQSLSDVEPGGRVAAAFETALATPRAEPRTLLRDVKGLGALGWLDHPTGAKLIYLAPGEGHESGAKGDDAGNGNDSDGGEGDRDDEDGELSDAEATGAGKPQAWMLDPADGVKRQLTRIEQGIGNLKPSPTGTAIAFTVAVKLDPELSDLHPDLPKADARIIDSLLYRHWNRWHDGTYSHVHVAEFDNEGRLGKPRDLMPSMRADCPVPPFGGGEQLAFSPDGQELALTLKLVNNPAESTDTGIYLVPLAGGPLKHITPGMPGYDMEPIYSPDGGTIAFHSMRRASFESDRNRIMLYDRATEAIREVTQGLDRTTHHTTWSPNGRRLYFHSETRGTTQAYAIDLVGEGPSVRPISRGRFDFAVVAAIPGGNRVLLRQQSMLRPTELAVVDADSGSLMTVTDVNGKIYRDLELPQIEERWVTASDGKSIHNWVILPPDYDPESPQQWPLLTYCQGGPQGQIGQWFSYRWNFHLMAAKGYVVLAVNRRGLPGFGREWNDQISGDWGGQAMQDILAATDEMVANPKIDPQRIAAIGASFGGYTVYWLMGNSEDRFCAMISHCGVFNLESMYGSTEELFFVNWDMGGPYWKSESLAERYRRFSPHQFVGNWKTPLLVIHGEKDFRVPVTQGMEAFTAAQVQGVPSRFLYFPEEGHWVLSPQNGVLWGRVFFDWLGQHCPPGTPE